MSPKIITLLAIITSIIFAVVSHLFGKYDFDFAATICGVSAFLIFLYAVFNFDE